MAIAVKVPAVGESITEVTIANWIKQNGELVRMDEVIAELESEKATFELTAPAAGKLIVRKHKGDAVPIGEVVCEIEEASQADAAPAKPAAPAAKPAAASPAATGAVKEMKVPAVGESITEVTISTWLKKEGDLVKQDEIIAEVESDKATCELPAEATGLLRSVAKAKDTLPIGGWFCKIEVMESIPSGSAP
ncbi:MAG: biotin/lipoyl-containing protein, partial [Bacteroidota bacterium]